MKITDIKDLSRYKLSGLISIFLGFFIPPAGLFLSTLGIKKAKTDKIKKINKLGLTFSILGLVFHVFCFIIMPNLSSKKIEAMENNRGGTSAKSVINDYWQYFTNLDLAGINSCYPVDEEVDINFKDKDAKWNLDSIKTVKIEDTEYEKYRNLYNINFEEVSTYKSCCDYKIKDEDSTYIIEFVIGKYNNIFYILDTKNIETIIKKEEVSEEVIESKIESTEEIKKEYPNSSTWINFEDMHFYLNETKFTLGKSKLSDIKDNKIESKDIDLDTKIKPGEENTSFSIKIDDYYYAQLTILNDSDKEKEASDCIIVRIFIPIRLSEMQNKISFDFPVDLSKEELKEKIGEPNDSYHYEKDELNFTELTYRTDAKENFGYKKYVFEYIDDELSYITLSYKK